MAQRRGRASLLPYTNAQLHFTSILSSAPSRTFSCHRRSIPRDDSDYFGADGLSRTSPKSHGASTPYNNRSFGGRCREASGGRQVTNRGSNLTRIVRHVQGVSFSNARSSHHKLMLQSLVLNISPPIRPHTEVPEHLPTHT